MKLVRIEEVQPSTYNPRSADPKRLDMIEISLRKLGFLLPLYATEQGELLSGHQRHHVAKRMGLQEIPVVYTKPMDLFTRKGVNILFNRATNDFEVADTSARVTNKVEKVDIVRMIAGLKDVEDFFPCLGRSEEDIEPFLKANKARWLVYALRVSRSLAKFDVRMPIIARRNRVVINGIGRLEHAAELGEDKIQVITIDEERADLAEHLMNLISMDFDINARYEDFLRHNSFRRSFQARKHLGHGFLFASADKKIGYETDIKKESLRRRWVAEHGKLVLDFGAGHLTETRILRSVGISVIPFEPYHIKNGEIDKPASLAICRKFLDKIADKRIILSSIFISSVFNSVPFREDRRKITLICAALSTPQTRLYIHTRAKNSASHQALLGAKRNNKEYASNSSFVVDYEPNTILGSMSQAPKAQKFYAVKELYDLVKEFYEVAKVGRANDNVQAICYKPRKIDIIKLREALEFEFDLPYPDQSRMGLVAEAKAAFSERLGIAI